jgi:transcriptional regulator with XRE-family HTH domain
MDIKKFRTEKGYTQKEFAEFCGVTERTVQNWEKGNTYPSLLKKYIELTEQDEKFSQEIKGNSNTAVAVSGTGNSVNSISERFISLLEQKDIQMNRLISLLEERKV